MAHFWYSHRLTGTMKILLWLSMTVLWSRVSQLVAGFDSFTASRDSTESLLGKMEGRSLVREWDAIMAVKAERVNRIWKKQYDDGSNDGFVSNIITSRKLSTETRKTKIEVRFMLALGPPMIDLSNRDEAILKIRIKSGTVEYWDTNKKDGNIDNYNETLRVSDNTLITGRMNLVKHRESLSGADKIVLDLGKGVFDVVNVNLYSDVLSSMKNELKIFFTTQLKSENYELAKITYKTTLAPASLVPDKFYLKTGGFGTPEKPTSGSLFIFFKMHLPGSKANEQTKRDFNDPLSIYQQIIPTGYEIALFINNRIIFKEIMAKDIQTQFGFGVHTKILPVLDSSSSQQSLYVVGDSDARRNLHMVLPFDRHPDIHFTFPIPGNTLQAKSINKGKKLQVHWVNSGHRVSVPYADHKCSWGRSGSCWNVVKHKKVSFTTTYIKTFTPNIDREQTITYTAEESGSASSSALSGWDGCFWLGPDVKSAKNKVTSEVETYMSGFRFNFQSISTFAITQVLFPGNNVFHLTHVYIPGDMVILGTVNTDQ